MAKASVKLNEKLTLIQVGLKASKGRKNNFGNYAYRSAEDILEALKPHLSEQGVNVRIVENVSEVGGQVVLTSTALLTDNETGEAIEAVAIVGVDFDQKGMAMPQRFGSASSYAKKYALGNLFLIDDTQDADATNTHGKGAPSKKRLTKEVIGKMKEAVANGNGAKVEAALSGYECSAAQRKEILG